MKNILFFLLLCSLSVNAQVVPFGFMAEAAAGCLDPGTFPSGNAASCPSTDATTGWTALQSTTLTSEVVSGRDFVMQCVANNSNSSQGMTIGATLVFGETYDVSYDYRVTNAVSSTQVARAWTGFTTSPEHTFETDGVWRTRTESGLVANSSLSAIRFYSTRIGAAGANTIQIDNVRVVQQ